MGTLASSAPRERFAMKPKYAAFAALDPFLQVIQRGLSGLVAAGKIEVDSSR
jgi:hypothetical protein